MRTKLLFLFLVFLLLSWILAEVRWLKINTPNGNFASLAEYLAQERRPDRICEFTSGAVTYVMAYGPMDTWLAFPSGPAAYVFDRDGGLVDWSRDVGDDAAFAKRWPSEPCNGPSSIR